MRYLPLLLIPASLLGQTTLPPSQISKSATAPAILCVVTSGTNKWMPCAIGPGITISLVGGVPTFSVTSVPSAGAVTHFSGEINPTLNADGSITLSPQAGETAPPDAGSFLLTMNGQTLTAIPTSNGLPDYTVDPANPYHLIPTAPGAWAGMDMRVRFRWTQ